MNRECELYFYYFSSNKENKETCSSCDGELDENGYCVNCDEDHED